MLIEMTEKELSFLEFGLKKSKENYNHYLDLDLDIEELEFFKNVTEESHKTARSFKRMKTRTLKHF